MRVCLNGLPRCKKQQVPLLRCPKLTGKGRLGAKKVVIFDHIVRHEPYYPREQYSMGIRGPAMRPHIDVTHKVWF